MTNQEKVLGYYGAEIFTEWNDEATFIMESCYTSDDYIVYWCHGRDEHSVNLNEDIYYYPENCVDIFKDALCAGESIYISEDFYDEIYGDDIIEEIAEAMDPEEVDGEILDTK